MASRPAAFRPHRLAPKDPGRRVALAVLGLGAPAAGVLLGRRRAPGGGPRTLVAGLARTGPHPIWMACSAGAGALAAGYAVRRRRRNRRADWRVRDVMTSNPVVAEPSMLLGEAAQLMKSGEIGALPVVQDGLLVGMLTDRDVLVRVVAEGRDVQSVHVGDIASREIVTTDPGRPLDEAMRLMARSQVRRLPVVEGTRLVGVLSEA